MIIQHHTGNRCQGLYRGVVIQHLQHGRLKVFVYGVYPEEYKNSPDLLPICEQMTPLWAGTNNGNGCFSYPNIGSSVLIQFLNDDVNYPIVIGATLGGQNAYHQYEQIKDQNEEISKKHMFTTGMAHFKMHESGKISSYVQQPFDNNVSIDFKNGDISCDVNNDIEKKINNNELSHIVCQNVLDNEINLGEISSSTHIYVPIIENQLCFLSNTNEIILSSTNGSNQFLNFNIRNNNGQTFDQQISSNEILQDMMYTNLNNNSMQAAQIEDKQENENVFDRTIDGINKIELIEKDINNINLFEINGITQEVFLSAFNKECINKNIDHNKLNDKKELQLNKQLNCDKNYSYINPNLKKLSTLNQNILENNNYNFKIDLDGNYCVDNDITNEINQIYLTADQNAAITILSTGNYNDTYNSIQNINLYQQNNKSNIIKNNKAVEQYIEVSPSKNIISTLDLNNTSSTTDNKTSDEITHNIINTTKLLSTSIDLILQRIIIYDEITNKNGDLNIKNNLNCDLNLQYTQNIESSEIFSNSITSVTSDINIQNVYSMNENGVIELGHSTITALTTIIDASIIENQLTNEHGILIDSEGLGTQIYNSKHIVDKNSSIVTNQIDLDTTVDTIAGDSIKFKTTNFQNNTINKESKFEIITDQSDTKTTLQIYDKLKNIQCSTEMDTNNENIKININNITSENTAEISLNTLNEIITIDMNGNIPCKIMLDSATGYITLISDKVKIKAESGIILDSNSAVDINSTALNVNSNEIALNSKITNIKSVVNINDELNINGRTTIENNFYVNGLIYGTHAN